MIIMKNADKNLLESLIEKYGVVGVEAAINKLNEDYDDREFEDRELIYREIYNALEDACFRLERGGIKITPDVIETGVEWFNMHNDFFDVE